MDDAQEIIGKWTVPLKQWVWEYEFYAGGKVVWRDTRSAQSGEGRWAMSGKLVNMWWINSGTKESWTRPLKQVHQPGWYAADYFTGPYFVDKIMPSRGATDITPEVADVGFDKYVDNFTEAKYDMNYKVPATKSFAFSPLLQLTYSDGVRIELDCEASLSDDEMSSDEMRDAMAHGRLGAGGRIFPTALTYMTTPRLFRAWAEALAEQDKEAAIIMGMMIQATAVVLTMPAMGAGAPRSTVISRAVGRRVATGTAAKAAPILNGIAHVGEGNLPGSLWSRIQQSSSEGVIYVVEMIFLEGKGPTVATARATHREMIRQAAQQAQRSGLRTFRMVGKQANPNFVKHANKLAQEVGTGAPGRQYGGGGGMYGDFEVVLDVGKVLTR